MTERTHRQYRSRWTGRVLATLLWTQAAAPQAVWAAESPADKAGSPDKAPAPDKAEEAAALSIVAKGKADAGEFALAAEMYLQAWRLYAKETGYLYSAARCFHKAARWEDAGKAYAEFGRVAPADHPARSKALGYQEEVRRAAADEQERRQALERLEQERKQLADERARQAQKQADQQKDLALRQKIDEQAALRTQAELQAQQGRWRRTAGWSVAGAGLVLSGIGAWLLWNGLDTAGGLERDLAVKDPQSGKIAGIDRERALATRSEALQDQTVGGSLLAVGLVGAGAGLWLALGERATSVAVRANGVMVGWRF